MGQTETIEGLADYAATLLRDARFDLAGRDGYQAAVLEASERPVETNAVQCNLCIYTWTTAMPLSGVEIVEPVGEAQYLIYEPQGKMLAAGDGRPSIVVRGTPVDMGLVRRLILQPLLVDEQRAKRYLMSVGVPRENTGGWQGMINRIINKGGIGLTGAAT